MLIKQITQNLIFLVLISTSLLITGLGYAYTNIDPNKAQAHLVRLLTMSFNGDVLDKDKYENMEYMVMGDIFRYAINGPVSEYTSVVSSYKIIKRMKVTDGIEFTVRYKMIGILADYRDFTPRSKNVIKKYKIITNAGNLFVQGGYTPYMGLKAAIKATDNLAVEKKLIYFSRRWNKKIPIINTKYLDLVNLMYYDKTHNLKTGGKELQELLITFKQSELKLIRNAIFARKKFQFSTKSLSDFYTKTYPGYNAITRTVDLTETDKENIQYLLNLEKSKGSSVPKESVNDDVEQIASNLLEKEFKPLELMSLDDLSEYNQEMFPITYGKRNPGWIFADFNGDSNTDIAFLGVNRAAGKGAVFFIYLGDKKGSYNLSYQEKIRGPYESIFILPIPKGEIPRASVKKVSFKTLSIRLIYMGKRIQDYLYWDNKKKKFSKIRNDRNKQ